MIRSITNLDHIDRLDDAGGEHTGGTAIDEGFDGGPDSGLALWLPLCHLRSRDQSSKEREKGKAKGSTQGVER